MEMAETVRMGPKWTEGCDNIEFLFKILLDIVVLLKLHHQRFLNMLIVSMYKNVQIDRL